LKDKETERKNRKEEMKWGENEGREKQSNKQIKREGNKQEESGRWKLCSLVL
jgi:hypothetical protein